MKAIYKIIIVCTALLSIADLFAQPGRNIAKQSQGINGILRATANARIHANSNSVFGMGNNHSNYSNKDQTKKNEIKPDKEIQKNNKTKNKKNNRD